MILNLSYGKRYNMNYFLLVILVLSVVLIYFSETFSWFFKSLGKESKGSIISLGNMLIYSSRIFAFSYMISMSYLIETGRVDKDIALFIAIALLLSGFVHLLFYNKKSKIKIVVKIYLFIFNKFKIRTPSIDSLSFNSNVVHVKHKKIYLLTAFSTILFNLALTLPYIMSTYFIEYRLTISSFIPLLNFIGSVPIVFYIDNYLFQAMDDGKLDSIIRNYYRGRCLGLFFTSVVMLFIFLY
ncbi:MAG: hypothetical protein ACJA2M_002549 [Polaribacter sp.]|jgi:hypothetical protein